MPSSNAHSEEHTHVVAGENQAFKQNSRNSHMPGTPGCSPLVGSYGDFLECKSNRHMPNIQDSHFLGTSHMFVMAHRELNGSVEDVSHRAVGGGGGSNGQQPPRRALASCEVRIVSSHQQAARSSQRRLVERGSLQVAVMMLHPLPKSGHARCLASCKSGCSLNRDVRGS